MKDLFSNICNSYNFTSKNRNVTYEAYVLGHQDTNARLGELRLTLVPND